MKILQIVFFILCSGLVLLSLGKTWHYSDQYGRGGVSKHKKFGYFRKSSGMMYDAVVGFKKRSISDNDKNNNSNTELAINSSPSAGSIGFSGEITTKDDKNITLVSKIANTNLSKDTSADTNSPLVNTLILDQKSPQEVLSNVNSTTNETSSLKDAIKPTEIPIIETTSMDFKKKLEIKCTTSNSPKFIYLTKMSEELKEIKPHIYPGCDFFVQNDLSEIERVLKYIFYEGGEYDHRLTQNCVDQIVKYGIFVNYPENPLLTPSFHFFYIHNYKFLVVSDHLRLLDQLLKSLKEEFIHRNKEVPNMNQKLQKIFYSYVREVENWEIFLNGEDFFHMMHPHNSRYVYDTGKDFFTNDYSQILFILGKKLFEFQKMLDLLFKSSITDLNFIPHSDVEETKYTLYFHKDMLIHIFYPSLINEFLDFSFHKKKIVEAVLDQKHLQAEFMPLVWNSSFSIDTIFGHDDKVPLPIKLLCFFQESELDAMKENYCQMRLVGDEMHVITHKKTTKNVIDKIKSYCRPRIAMNYLSNIKQVTLLILSLEGDFTDSELPYIMFLYD